MPTNNKTRIQRRKIERQETVEIVINYAQTLGMHIINMQGIRPDTLEAALLLLLDAREHLPTDVEATMLSTNDEAHVAFWLTNTPSCPCCGSLMQCQSSHHV